MGQANGEVRGCESWRRKGGRSARNGPSEDESTRLGSSSSLEQWASRQTANIYESIGTDSRRANHASDASIRDLGAEQDGSRNNEPDQQADEARSLLAISPASRYANARKSPLSDDRCEPSHKTTGRRYQNANRISSSSHLEAGESKSSVRGCTPKSKGSDSDVRVSTLCSNLCHRSTCHPRPPVATCNCVEQELNHLMEASRKRTLFLLREKEAPKASFELMSPPGLSDMESSDDNQADSHSKQGETESRFSGGSQYENVPGSLMVE